MGSLRWTDEQFSEFQRRKADYDAKAKAEGRVRTHKLDDEDERKREEAKLERHRLKRERALIQREKKKHIPAFGEEVARRPSRLERDLASYILIDGLPEPKRNYRFLPDRKFELDFAWPELKRAVEVQGMVHRIKSRFKADIEKRALALFAGWVVLEVDGDSIRSGVAVEWVKKLLCA